MLMALRSSNNLAFWTFMRGEEEGRSSLRPSRTTGHPSGRKHGFTARCMFARREGNPCMPYTRTRAVWTFVQSPLSIALTMIQGTSFLSGPLNSSEVRTPCRSFWLVVCTRWWLMLALTEWRSALLKVHQGPCVSFGVLMTNN
jgi:hypothetical protein